MSLIELFTMANYLGYNDADKTIKFHYKMNESGGDSVLRLLIGSSGGGLEDNIQEESEDDDYYEVQSGGSSSHDDEYNESNYALIDDDLLYETNVEHGVEWGWCQ
ncbi:unnamed protein product [Ilex paraguariensis]|uniref:Uncharacterized protein n=1 Tax=Ilex paraguariensis TaxID=185542 RepID=A0ABC8R394_9AQUA